MLREAATEFAEVDYGQQSQLDPFARDKVVKIETGEASKTWKVTTEDFQVL